MATVLNNALVTFKDSRWLTLEVCREYQRNKCTRTDTECKYAHPLPHVEIQNGRVTACFDSIKGRCNREKPPCKYLHPPQHLKEQLLVNGRNNLALKNAALMGQIAAFSPFLPATLNAGAVGATALAGGCPLTCSVTAPTSPPPPYLPPSAQQGATLISLGAVAPGDVMSPGAGGAANHHGPSTPLGYALNFHPSSGNRTSQFLALQPPGQHGGPPAAYQLILNHHPAAAYQANPAKAALTRSPFLNGCQQIENGPGPTLFLHNGTTLTLAAAGLVGPSAGPTLVNGLPPSYCINGSNGKPAANPFQHRQDRMEVCREYQRGNCKRSLTECKYAHPPDHVLVDCHTSTVTVCIDALKGRCTRGEQQCRYFHPPQPQQQINYQQQQQQQQQLQYLADSGVNGGVMLAVPTAHNGDVILSSGPGAINTTSQRLSADATAFRPTDVDVANPIPDPATQSALSNESRAQASSQLTPDCAPPLGRLSSATTSSTVNGADASTSAVATSAPTSNDLNPTTGTCNGIVHANDNPTDGLYKDHADGIEGQKKCFNISPSPDNPSSTSPTISHHKFVTGTNACTTVPHHKTTNPICASDGPRARKRARQEPTPLYYNTNDLTGSAFMVCSMAPPQAQAGTATVLVSRPGQAPLYSLYVPHLATGHSLQLHPNLVDAGCAGQQQLYLHHATPVAAAAAAAAANASNILAAPMSAMLSLQHAPPPDPKRPAPTLYDSNGHAAQVYGSHQQQHYYQAAGPAQAQIIYAPPGAAAHHIIQHGHPHPGAFQPPHHFIPVAFASPATANGLPPY